MTTRPAGRAFPGASWEPSQASCVVFGQSPCTAHAAVALLRVLTGRGLRAVGMMPVSTGEGHGAGALAALAAAGAFALPREAICPYVFEEAGAAAVLAQQHGITLGLDIMVDTYQALATWSDGVVVAAPGDVQQPLGKTFCLCDFARELALPAVLVVDGKGHGPRAACATAEVLRQRSVPLAGWVAVTDAAAPALDDAIVRRLAGSPLGTLVPSLAGRQGKDMPGERAAGGTCLAQLDPAAVLDALRGPWP